MAYVLPRLEAKKDVDTAIKSTVDKVLVLRFGRETDAVCMQLDEIVSAAQFPASGDCPLLYPHSSTRYPVPTEGYYYPQQLFCSH